MPCYFAVDGSVECGADGSRERASHLVQDLSMYVQSVSLPEFLIAVPTKNQNSYPVSLLFPNRFLGSPDSLINT